ncbi:MAG: MaoC/PaaZ C-terminal domain-containing protein [Anaerolineae bacterium]
MPDRYFDEIEIGQKWVTKGRTITEADVVNFAYLSGDWHSIHTDQEYAAQTSFGRRIAHGALVLSISTGMVPAKRETVLALYGLDRVRFIAPVFIGDTVHLEMEAVEKKDRDDGTGVVGFDYRIVNQHGQPVVVCLYKLWMSKRPTT